MSKMKKSLQVGSGVSDGLEYFTFKPKDLIWAKMKGFPPWPAMIINPSHDLLQQSRKPNMKCVFFFGTRNFGWIEWNNIKPFEGPWKEQLTRGNKPNSFRNAMEDIKNYIDDPNEVDDEIRKIVPEHDQVTTIDFDKVRDGLTEESDDGGKAIGTTTALNSASSTTNDNAVTSNNTATNNGLVASVPGVGEAINNDEDDEPQTTQYKVPEKTPTKTKNSSAISNAKHAVKATSTTGTTTAAATGSTGATSTPHKVATKRPRLTSAPTAKRKQTNATPPQLTEDYMRTGSPSSSIRRRNREASEISTVMSMSNYRRNPTSIGLLDRPIIPRPEPQPVDMSTRSQTLAEREIVPSNLTFGFLGLGIMGSAIVKDLLCTGHKIVVWNRTLSKCKPFEDAGAIVKPTPVDVVEASDIIFCCVSEPKASKDLVFGNCGVLRANNLANKAYVEMSTIDPETSNDIAEGIRQCNGRYLEVQIHGTRQEAEDGMLIILAGGDRTVFEDCHSCFKTIAKNTFFLGAEVGNACKVNLVLQTIIGVSLVGLAEALALADRFSISLKDIIDIFELTSMKSQLLLTKGKEMAKGDFNPQQPLSHMQKDLRLVLSMAENMDQSMPVTAITNEVFKHTKRLGYSEHDSSAVFSTI